MQFSRPMRLTGIALAAACTLALSACSGGEETDSFQIAVNTDGGHQAWSDAVTNQISNTLGIKSTTKSYASFDELRTDVTERTIKTAFRTGWQPDYPSIYNYLQPIYFTNAGSNDGDYSNEEFDDFMRQVSAAQDPEDAYTLQAQGQAVLMQDLPAIPLWYQNISAVYSKKVDNVEFNWQNQPEYAGITKSGGGAILTHGTQPQNPLVPTATNEVGGGNVIDQMFEGLVRYKADGEAVNAVADSITSNDNKTWTVKIKDGQQFSDGSPVTANSFVKAWNYGAVGKNAQLNSYFFYPIVGFNDAQEDKSDELSGLKVVDDHTFTIELEQAEASFPARLGYSAFYPLPEKAFDDLEAYGHAPIGNGPYKMASDDAWEDDVQISLVANDNYKGDVKVKNDGLTFKFYTSLDAAYTDVQAGNLDVLEQVPEGSLKGFTTDAKVNAISEPGSVFQSFTIPVTLEHFGMDEEGRLRRAAISMAIDREAITEKVFHGTRTPAADFSSPLMPGWTDQIEGNDVLQYNPEKAKELWAKANEISEWKTGK